MVDSAYIIVSSASSIQSNTAASQQTLSLYEDQLNGLKDNMDIFKAQYFDSITDWGIYVVEVAVGFILVASLAVIIGTVSVICL